MSKSKYDEIGEEMAQAEDCETGQMFGKPCLKSNGKAFAAFFQGDMAFKLGRDQVQEKLTSYPGSHNWDPSGKGRPMKDWLQVPAAFQAAWPELAEEALGFLRDSQ